MVNLLFFSFNFKESRIVIILEWCIRHGSSVAGAGGELPLLAV